MCAVVERRSGNRALLVAKLLIALLAPAKVAAEGTTVPIFRHLDASLAKVARPQLASLRLLVPDDLPPFAFRNRRGALTGYAVAVAQAVCRRARIRCRFVARPAVRLPAMLLSARGDVIVAGPRPLPEAWQAMDFTRPYFRALAQFAVRRDAKIRQAEFTALTGRRIAVVKGTLHAAWVHRHVQGARISLQPDFTQAAMALKEGRADVLFADWLQLAFWLPSKTAENCCRALAGFVHDRSFAYNNLSMAVGAGQRNLRDFLDRQLDLLQEDGELRILARRYLPLAARRQSADTSGKAVADIAKRKGAKKQP